MALDQEVDIYEESEQEEMSFLDHLEELRWHLIRSLIAIGVITIAAFFAKDIVFGIIILGPSKADFFTYQMLCKASQMLGSTAFCMDELPFIIQSRKMTGQFTMHILSSLVIGFVVAFPYVFWETWRFIRPGLYPHEAKASRGAVFSVTFLFLLGILFGYYVVCPISVNFLANYSLDASIQNEFDVVSYVSTVTMLVLTCGIMFQLPMVVVFLTKAGLVGPESLKGFRKLAVVIILVISAVLTPPDVISQILIALPLLLLYEFSIVISGGIVRRQNKE